MGKLNQSTLAPHFLFARTSPITPHFPLISPHFPPFPPAFLGTGYITGTLLGILPPTSSGYF